MMVPCASNGNSTTSIAMRNCVKMQMYKRRPSGTNVGAQQRQAEIQVLHKYAAKLPQVAVAGQGRLRQMGTVVAATSRKETLTMLMTCPVAKRARITRSRSKTNHKQRHNPTPIVAIQASTCTARSSPQSIVRHLYRRPATHCARSALCGWHAVYALMRPV